MEIIKPNLSLSRWREKIVGIFFIIIGLIFLAEITMLFLFGHRGLLSNGMTGKEYLIQYVTVPTGLNLIIVFICHRINVSSMSDQVKNYAIPITSSAFTSIVAFVHCDIYAILTIFSLPIFLTVLFCQRRMTDMITLLNLGLLVFSTIHTAIYYQVYTSVDYYLNFVVGFTLLISSYLISSVLISYNKASKDYISSSYQNQLTLTEQARNDSLTGLYNQKTFHSLLKASLEKAKHLKSPMALAIIDIDDFKEINDTHGHLTGDQVLLHFTDLMKQQCKDGDAFISRYGGDEFAVIFPKASKELAYLRLESLRQRCSQVSHGKLAVSNISFSAGIAQFLDEETNETLLFHQADTALYHAKENGKGQTAIYPN